MQEIEFHPNQYVGNIVQEELDGMVFTLVNWYSFTRNITTGFSPYIFMFGRQSMLTWDMMFNIRSPDTEPIARSKYIWDLQKQITTG